MKIKRVNTIEEVNAIIKLGNYYDINFFEILDKGIKIDIEEFVSEILGFYEFLNENNIYTIEDLIDKYYNELVEDEVERLNKFVSLSEEKKEIFFEKAIEQAIIDFNLLLDKWNNLDLKTRLKYIEIDFDNSDDTYEHLLYKLFNYEKSVTLFEMCKIVNINPEII